MTTPMLVIRKKQQDALGQVALRGFEDEMVAHLAACSPPLFQAVKEDQMRAAIRFGIDHASEYGITFRGPLRLYLELMLLFGSRFDADPQYGWAAEILQDEELESQMERADLLCQKTRDYQEVVAGPEAAYQITALGKFSDLAGRDFAFSSDGFTDGLLGEMERIHPQKAAYVGEPALRVLIDSGAAEADSRGFSTVRERALPGVLMFAFGSGCFDDPLYPWISEVFTNEKLIDPPARAARLEKRAFTWLDHVLANFGEDNEA